MHRLTHFVNHFPHIKGHLRKIKPRLPRMKPNLLDYSLKKINIGIA